jgi:hypothetical protein
MIKKETYQGGLGRKKAVGIGEIIPKCLRSMGLSYGMNSHLVYSAWDTVSGAGPFTLRKYYRSGILYITVNSSVIRNQLYFQKNTLVEKINGLLSENDFFDNNVAGTGYVKDIILK